jgi:excisionase family DNA binding protein
MACFSGASRVETATSLACRWNEDDVGAVAPRGVTRDEIMARMDEGDMAMEDAARGDDRLLKAAEVQRELGVSRATAYRMMTDGTLPSYRFGGRHGRRPMVRVSRKELRAWLDVHRAAPPSAA